MIWKIRSTMSFKEKLKPCVARKKRVLILFNLLSLVMGLCIISTGSHLSVYPLNYGEEKTTYEHFFDVRFFPLVKILYTIGIIMSVVSFLGLVGAFTDSIFILMLFCGCLATTFIVEVTFAVTGYVMRHELKESLTHAMNTMMHDYGTNGASRRTIDTIQQLLGCCGVMKCQEWERSLFSTTSEEYGQSLNVPHYSYIASDECRINSTTDDSSYRLNLPSSCCGNRNNYYQCLGISVNGCIPKLEFIIQFYCELIASLPIIVATMQITGILFACLVAKALYVRKLKHGIKYSLLGE